MSGEAAGVRLASRAGGVEFAVKVVPGASRSRVMGVLGEALKVAVAAPPEAGKANSELLRLLGQVLGVRRGDIELVAGQTNAQKRVRVAGMTPEAVRERLRARTPGR